MTGHEADRIADIQAGIDEADKGEFATNAEVAATIRKYAKRMSPLVVLSEAKDLAPTPKDTSAGSARSFASLRTTRAFRFAL